MKSTEILIQEHDAVLYALSILEKICGLAVQRKPFEHDHMRRMLDFLRTFVDRCHHGKEEDVLFPELEKAGVPRENGPVGVMLAEHDTGRRYIREMSDAFDRFAAGDEKSAAAMAEAARSYIGLLMPHIEKENMVLYRMADARLSAATDDAMVAKFDAIENERVGAGKHEEFHEMLAELGSLYLDGCATDGGCDGCQGCGGHSR